LKSHELLILYKIHHLLSPLLASPFSSAPPLANEEAEVNTEDFPLAADWLVIADADLNTDCLTETEAGLDWVLSGLVTDDEGTQLLPDNS